MSFLSGIADRTPIVGHVKGVYHYARGETEEGDEAMYQSSRTSAVIGGGMVGGPAGAMAAGLATDTVASAVTGEDKGLVKSSKDIGRDLACKRNPTRSILSTGLQLGFDAMCGSGSSYKSAGDALKKTWVNSAKSAVRETVIGTSKEAVEKVTRGRIGLGATSARIIFQYSDKDIAGIITELKEHDRRERERERKAQESERQRNAKVDDSTGREQRANSEKQQRATSGSSAGSSQPPQGNKGNNRNRKEAKEPSFFEIFMALLRKILKNVYGNESEPFSTMFENLSKEHKKYLLKVLKPLMRFGTLDVVIELVIRLFKQHFARDISFGVFLSLLEYVQTHIADELLERTLISSGTETAETKMTPNDRREKIISEIASEKDIIDKLINLFQTLKTEIEAETATWDAAFPNFRDIFAAVYHYYKHRRVPADGRILSVKEYYAWIRKFLIEVKTTQGYTLLKNAQVPSYVNETFVPTFCRRFKIVLSLHGSKIVLSSAFVVEMMHPDDNKHVVFMVAQTLIAVLMFTGLFYILKGVFFCAGTILLNTPLMVTSCISFTGNLLLNTLLFFFGCLIFILKVLLNILFIFILLRFLFFFLPDAR